MNSKRFYFYSNTTMLAPGIKGIRIQLEFGSELPGSTFMRRRTPLQVDGASKALPPFHSLFRRPGMLSPRKQFLQDPHTGMTSSEGDQGFISFDRFFGFQIISASLRYNFCRSSRSLFLNSLWFRKRRPDSCTSL